MTNEVRFDVSVRELDDTTKTITFAMLDGRTIRRQCSAGTYWKVIDVGVLYLSGDPA